jgi:hypothetical protein
MITQLQEDVVRGPEETVFGKTLTVIPTVEASRANRFPSQAVVVTCAARKLIELSRESYRLHALVVGGEGQDPTRHPEFHEICQNLRELLNKHYPKAKFTLLSDIPNLEEARTRHALTFFDQPILRLEAGFGKTFAALSGADPKLFKSVVENMSRVETEKLIIKANFVRGTVDNSKDSEVKAWVKHLGEIKPCVVRITSEAKDKDKGQKSITKTRMTQIAELVTETTGIPVEVA